MTKIKLNDFAEKYSTGIIALSPSEKEMSGMQSDVHFVRHLNMQYLPPMIQRFLTFATTDAEKDILLFSLLVSVGSVLPNVYCIHGRPIGKKYYPNLMCVIESGAATGKGIARMAIDLVADINTKEVQDVE